jgi:hypothetical protein
MAETVEVVEQTDIRKQVFKIISVYRSVRPALEDFGEEGIAASDEVL